MQVTGSLLATTMRRSLPVIIPPDRVAPATLIISGRLLEGVAATAAAAAAATYLSRCR
jgi:hypothetical protein